MDPGSAFPSHLALGPGTRRQLLDGLRWIHTSLAPLYGPRAPRPAPWWPSLPIPGGGVVLGSWTSPAGFPWDIGVIRVRWDFSKGSAVLPDFPALLLQPRPWPRLADPRALAREFRLYQCRKKGEPPRRTRRWAPGPATPTVWASLPGQPAWGSPARAWEGSLAILDQLDPDTLEAEPLDPDAAATRNTRIWRDAPWLFLLHPALQEVIQQTLGLPFGLDASPCLAAAHVAETGSKGRKGAWPPGRMVARKPGAGHPEPVHVAYDWLMDRFDGQSRAVVAFLEGQDDPEHITVSTEDIPKKLSERLAELRDGFAQPTLVPLFEEALPAAEGRTSAQRDDVLALWLSSRCPQALWLCFGSQAGRLHMAAADGGSVTGLDAILRVQHRGHLQALDESFRRKDSAWGWRWVLPTPDDSPEPGADGQTYMGD